MHIHFIDFERAFDSVHQESLWLIMKIYGIQHKVVPVIRMLYGGFQCSVIDEDEITVWFPMITQVKLGSACQCSTFIVLDTSLAFSGRTILPQIFCRLCKHAAYASLYMCTTWMRIVFHKSYCTVNMQRSLKHVASQHALQRHLQALSKEHRNQYTVFGKCP